MPDTAYKRPIRSYVRREGRLTTSQQRALDTLWQHYGINADHQRLNFSKIFSNNHPVILEIGFGNGELLAAKAQQHPGINFLGIEVHRPGVGHLLLQLEKHSIENVRIISLDAMEILETSVPENSLQALWLFFPDPWPKKKHHKRRIVTPKFLDLAARALMEQGILHMATDWQDYAEYMEATVRKDRRYIMSTPPYDDYLLESRPNTKFEHRGQCKGHEITDLVYRVLASQQA